MKPRAIPKKEDYMDKVVTLYDVDGNVLFRGTRRACAEFSRGTFEKRMEDKHRSSGAHLLR